MQRQYAFRTASIFEVFVGNYLRFLFNRTDVILMIQNINPFALVNVCFIGGNCVKIIVLFLINKLNPSVAVLFDFLGAYRFFAAYIYW